jgi:DHA2 family multidrug resistance protein
LMASRGGVKLLEGTLSSQARLWSYVDDFRYMALVCFACIPLVFLFKRAKGRGGTVHAE